MKHWACLVLLCGGALTTYAQQGPGFALRFDGAGDNVLILHTNALNAFPLTVTTWLRTTQSAFDPPIVAKLLSTESNGWQTYLLSGNIRARYLANSSNFLSGNNGGLPGGLNGGFVADNAFHHVAFTVDAAGGKLYMDGALRDSRAWVGTPGAPTTTELVRLGLWNGISFIGTLDEVMIWNVALTAAQIQTNMHRSLVGTEPGLIAYYRFNEASGSTTADSAPAGGDNQGFLGGPARILSGVALQPLVTTLSAIAIAGASATLNGTANPNNANTSGWFEWGATTNYGNLTPPQGLGAGAGDTNFSGMITGLAASATHHFRAVASNSFGAAFGTNQTFKTLGPTVQTLPANVTGSTTVTLNGTVNPNGTNTSGWFEWGTTTNYGNLTALQALGSGLTSTNFSEALTGLVVGVTYHFRAATSNRLAIAFGRDQSFSMEFTDSGMALTGVLFGAVAWGDYDNDGRLDILLTGESRPTPTNFLDITQVWRNTGSGFSNINAGLPGVEFGSVAWGDYDNDGRLDILLTGNTNFHEISQVWRNTGNGFTNINAGLTGVSSSSVAWGDYDNNGQLDILLTGSFFVPPANSVSIAEVWRNTGNGFANINAGLPGVSSSSVAWGDYDNDGRLDILLAGQTFIPPTNIVPITQVWRNTGSGFSNINAGLPGIFRGAVAWGDYDNDGRLDILLAGLTDPGPGFVAISQIWRNTGQGFTNINADLPGISDQPAAWGDYDNDGRLDVLLGRQVWRNTGSGFENINAGLPLATDSAVWGDYDNDGRLDILLTGRNANNALLTQVWHNNAPLANTPPAAPTGLGVAIAGGVATFSWNAASDAQTPASGLTYNLRVGATPGGADLVGPMAGNNGQRRLPRFGNAQQNLSLPITSLPFGQPIYFSVQAVDAAFAGSSFAAPQSFTFNTVFTPPNGVPVPGDINADGVVDETELNAVLSNYFPNSPFLQMTNVAGLGGTNVTFALTNSLAGAFSVEFTTNLMDWFFLGPAKPRYLFADTNAPAEPQRYYRLRWP